jgi:hypothetical protein
MDAATRLIRQAKVREWQKLNTALQNAKQTWIIICPAA